MQGRIKMFNSDKGFGFIVGEDGNDYFAHISNVNSIQELHVGLFVSFEPNENDKGKYATKVMVIESKKPTFIAFGDVRIKTSNIKNYGLSTLTRYYVKVYGFVENDSDGWLKRNFSLKAYASYWRYIGIDAEMDEKTYLSHQKHNFSDGCKYVKNKDGSISQTQTNCPVSLSPSDFSTKNVPYLYVTTYQNDNYTFYQDEVDFDIKAKCKEIDDCML